MVIGDSKAEPVLCLDNNVSNRVSECKDLGVIIDNACTEVQLSHTSTVLLLKPTQERA
jgi:hypothetical protein